MVSEPPRSGRDRLTRKASTVLTTLAVVATAAPVSAQDSVTGTATMDRHGGAEPCTAISWVGTMEIDGHGDPDGTYGYAHSTAEDIPATVIADGWLRWAEDFTLYAGLFERGADGLIVSCEPGLVLLHGYESGVGVADGSRWTPAMSSRRRVPSRAWQAREPTSSACSPSGRTKRRRPTAAGPRCLHGRPHGPAADRAGPVSCSRIAGPASVARAAVRLTCQQS